MNVSPSQVSGGPQLTAPEAGIGAFGRFGPRRPVYEVSAVVGHVRAFRVGEWPDFTATFKDA